MINVENVAVLGWEYAIRGMRNPMNSWDKSDSFYVDYGWCDSEREFDLAKVCGGRAPIIGDADLNLMLRLAKGGSVEAKYRRMIIVYADITAPLYWWKEYDTLKVGTVANSCSTMHKIHAKEFTLEDFSHEHLLDASINSLKRTVDDLNFFRERYLDEELSKNTEWKKEIWWKMIQLLPSSYNQKRTVMLNYEVLSNIYKSRKNHKLDEWREFCKFIETLPYSELITLKT